LENQVDPEAIQPFCLEVSWEKSTMDGFSAMLDYRMVFFVSLDGYPMADYMTIATADAANSSKSRASQL